MQSSKIKLMVPCGLKTLLEGVTQAAMENNPEDIAEFFAFYFQALATYRKEHPNLDVTDLVEQFEFISETGSGGLEENITECAGTLFSGEPKQWDKCTDTEEHQLLEEPDIQCISKSTQCSSVASSIAEGSFPPGSDGASAPEGPELVVYIPAEPAQLAAHVLGNCNAFCTVRDVATNVQTLHEDSQTSENEFTSDESAAEHASAVPAAETTVQAAGSQPGVWGQCSTAGELGLSACHADVSTNDINQASCITLHEEPSSLSPSPAPKDALQAMPSCKEAEVTSATDAESVYQGDEAMIDAEVPRYIEQFPQKIVIPFVDLTACLVKVEQPLNTGQGLRATALGSPDEDSECHPEQAESTARVVSAERVSVLSAMASSEAGQPPPPPNVWTLYCLNDLTQGQRSPSFLPPAGAAVPSSQGEDQHSGQLSQLPAPVYVMERDSEGKSAPPFILVGSNVQKVPGWKPLPGHALLAPPGPGARRRLTAVPVPVTRPAEEERDTARPGSHSAEGTGAEPCPPQVFSVAIPLDDVMAAPPGPPAAAEHTRRTGLAGSHSAAGQHRVRKN